MVRSMRRLTGLIGVLHPNPRTVSREFFVIRVRIRLHRVIKLVILDIRRGSHGCKTSCGLSFVSTLHVSHSQSSHMNERRQPTQNSSSASKTYPDQNSSPGYLQPSWKPKSAQEASVAGQHRMRSPLVPYAKESFIGNAFAD